MNENEHQSKREENLERLYELREELEIVAEADLPYSKYARNFLHSLRDAGYDVEIPERGSR